METSARLRQRLEAFATQLREEFGEIPADAEGCLLSVVEDWAVQAGDQLSQAIVQDQMVRPTTAEIYCCPKCGRPASRQEKRKRRVETRRGAVHVTEPECYCNRCRRSFFPSDSRVGDGT